MMNNEIIERKIFLKEQLIQITEKEIEMLKNELNNRGRVNNGHHSSGDKLRRKK